MAAAAHAVLGVSVTTPHGLRILIADDHEGFRHELCETLAREADFQVVADSCGVRTPAASAAT